VVKTDRIWIARVATLAAWDALMDDHTVKSLLAALRSMPPGAPIMVRVDDTLRSVSLVRPAWVSGEAEGQGGSLWARSSLSY
jgi:hypothetical protein